MNTPEPHLDLGQHSSDGERLVEHHAARVLELYPLAHVSRTLDAIQIDIHTDPDGERGVTVLVTPEAYELRLPTTEWTAGAYGPAGSTRYLKRVTTRKTAGEALDAIIRDAIARRDAEFQPCRYCERPTPPEHSHRDVCHACAERHLRVDH